MIENKLSSSSENPNQISLNDADLDSFKNEEPNSEAEKVSIVQDVRLSKSKETTLEKSDKSEEEDIRIKGKLTKNMKRKLRKKRKNKEKLERNESSKSNENKSNADEEDVEDVEIE